MNYEERYKEAVGRIEDYIPDENGMIHIKLEDIFSELKESEDENIRKDLIGYFEVCDNMTFAHHRVSDIITWLEKRVEQKPVDKVGPKFKVGDWIVRNYQNNDTVIHRVVIIRKIDDETYGYTLDDGTYFSSSFESSYHLWTIKDAKDGDVLSFKDVHGNDCIELIKNITDKKIEFWFCLTNGNRCVNGITLHINLTSRENATPATKEQCDLLFQKIHEAGYEWDAEKKELKKIEPRFKVGDTIRPKGSMTEYTIESISGECYHGKGWGLSIGCDEDYELVEQKSAWSGEDERIYQSIIDDTVQEAQLDIKQIKWLKSLKERVGNFDDGYKVGFSAAKYNQWKPNDEQMEALYTYIYNPQYFNSPDPRMELVESVYKDLKKLKEE